MHSPPASATPSFHALRSLRPLRTLRAGLALALLALGLFAGTAHAAVLRYSFEIDFATGPLGGQTAFGSFDLASVDCPGLVCSGTFTPSGSANPIVSSVGSLLAFNVVIDGVSFSIADDDGYPDFPAVELDANSLVRIDYIDLSGAPSLTLFGSAAGGWGGEYRDTNFDSSFVADIRQVGAPLLIPEPPTAALLAAALVLGAATSRLRRRA